MGRGADLFDELQQEATQVSGRGAALFDRRDAIFEEMGDFTPDVERVLSQEEQRHLEEQRILAEQDRIERESSTSLIEDVARFPGQALAGGAITAASLVNMGTELIEKLSRGAPFGDPNIVPGDTAIGNIVRGGTGAVAGAAQRISGPTLSPSDRLARNLGEEAAASAVFGPVVRGGGGLVRRFSPVQVPGTARAARQPIEDFVRDEALAATGTAVGRATAEEAGFGATGETVLGVGGALTPTVGGKVFRGATRGAFSMRGAFGSREDAAKALREELRSGDTSALINGRGSLTEIGARSTDAVRDVAGNRRAAQDLFDKSTESGVRFDEFNLGQAVDVPGVRDLQAKALSRNPEVAAMVEARRDSSMKALAEGMENMGGTPGLSSGDSGLAAMEMRLSKELSQVYDEARALVPDGLDPLAHNRRLSEETSRLLETLYDESVTAKNVLYDDISDLAETFGAQWDPSRMKQARAKVLDAAGRFENGALPPTDLMDEIAALETDGVRWADLGSLDRRINDELSNAANSKGQNRLLGMLKDGVSETMEQLERDPNAITFFRGDPSIVPTAGAGEILEETAAGTQEAMRSELVLKMRNANSFFRKHAMMFREGISGKVLTGNSSTGSAANDALLAKYLHAGPGGTRDAKAFIQTLGQSEKALQNGRDYLVGEAYRAALVPDPSGVMRLDRKKLGQWLEGHRRVLDLPAFKQTKKIVGTDLRLLAEEARKLGVPGIDDSITAADAALKKYLAAPDKVFTQIAGAQDPVEELTRITGLIQRHGDDAAMDAFKRRYWDNVVIQNGIAFKGGTGANRSIPTVKASHIDKVLSDPVQAKLLGQLYGKDHIDRLRTIADFQRGLDKIPTRVSSSGVELPTPAEDLKKAAKRAGMFSVIFGPVIRTVRGTMAAQEFRQSLSETMKDVVLEEAIVNEDVARILLSDATAENVKRLRRFLGTNVPSLGFRVEESTEFEQEDRLRRGRRREDEENARGQFVIQ